MERSICGSSLFGTRTAGARSSTVEQLKYTLEGHFTRESIILYQKPRVTEVGMVSRMEEVEFWKIDFRHRVYFRSV